MKKFSHKLEGLIKYYTFLEYQAKIELGEVSKKIQKINDDLAQYNQYIQKLLISNETLGQSENTNAGQLQIIPFILDDLRKHIDYLKKEKIKLAPIYQEKLKNLTQKKSKLDLIVKIKDKDKVEYLKKMEQVELQELLELGIVNKLISRSQNEF